MAAESDRRVMDPGYAPTPFTAAEIRAGCPTGRSIQLLVESSIEPPYERHILFVATDEIGATQDLWRTTPDGDPIGSSENVFSTWEELQHHASFPGGVTTIKTETIKLPIGRLKCLRYTVTEGAITHTFWFAIKLPGMPVKFTAHTDERLTFSSVMTKNLVT